MNYLMEALQWIADPANRYGDTGILARMGEHVLYTVVVLGIAALIGIPIGYAIGHFHRGRGIVVASTGAARALPTLGVLTLIGVVVGIGLVAPLAALVVLATPSVLAGAYSGVENVDRTTVDAARAQGMSQWQVLTRVEIPLGLPLLIGGLRSACLQVVATATLAAYVGGGGLGRFLFPAINTYNYTLMLAASILVMILAVVLDACFAFGERLVRWGVRSS
ncbi:MAG: ABC transporter permease subunit [Actinomycetaceae bacterium]|nr:ABC transporter permease subunit [Actinomycetaceae bacterium]